MIQEYLIEDSTAASDILDHTSDSIRQSQIKIGDSIILRIEKEGANLRTAKELSEIHKQLVMLEGILTLSDGCSEYFNKNLFPIINTFERKLRQLLYLGVALSDGSVTGAEGIRNLEESELGDLFSLLFTDQTFNNRVRSMNKEITWQYSKSWILNYINDFEETTLWFQLFEDRIPLLCQNYLKIKDYRNAVMHARSIDYEQYKEIRETYTVINEEIQLMIEELYDPEENIYHYYKEFAQSLYEQFERQHKIQDAGHPGLAFFELLGAYQKYLSSEKLDPNNSFMDSFQNYLERKDKPKSETDKGNEHEPEEEEDF